LTCARKRVSAFSPILRETLQPGSISGAWRDSSISTLPISPKELRRLETEGLFRSEVKRPPEIFPAQSRLSAVCRATKHRVKNIGAPSLIAQALKKIEGIEEAYLYGSFASNQQDAASDIDVLVIGAPRGEALAEAIRKIGAATRTRSKLYRSDAKELNSRRARKDAFLENVWHNKRVPLVGSA